MMREGENVLLVSDWLQSCTPSFCAAPTQPIDCLLSYFGFMNEMNSRRAGREWFDSSPVAHGVQSIRKRKVRLFTVQSD